MVKKSSPKMEALERMTPQHSDTDDGGINPMTLGRVDNTPKIMRDERLNQLAWLEVDKEIMLYKAIFYPENWKFKCRAALGAEIANFSTIDNEDPVSVNDGINALLKACLRIETGNGSVVSYKNLCEFDRLWFLLFIRDLTMQSTEQKVTFKVNCPHCGEENIVEMSFDNLRAIELSELARKYYNANEHAFVVTTKSYGILKFEPSTIYRGEAYMNYILDIRNKGGKQPAASFSALYPLLLTRETEKNPKAVNTALAQYTAISNDARKLSLYMKLAKELNVGLEQEISYICEGCEKEAHAPVQFPDGISSLLLMSDISSELL